MKTHWVTIFIGFCLVMFGIIYWATWMDYNGFWVVFSTGEKATTIFSIGGGCVFLYIGFKKTFKELKNKMTDFKTEMGEGDESKKSEKKATEKYEDKKDDLLEKF